MVNHFLFMVSKITYERINIFPFHTMLNWSVGSIQQSDFIFQKGIPLESIGNLIQRVKEKTQIKSDVLYKRVTIRLYNKGVIQRDEVLGKDIGTKTQYYVRSGQFIMSKIDARNGAFGIIPTDLEGAVVTQDFLAFDINLDKILPYFFTLLTNLSSFRELCQLASSGTTGRQRINLLTFLNFKIPLPPLEEQKVLVKSYLRKLNLVEKIYKEVEQIKVDIKNYTKSLLGIKRDVNSFEKKIFQLIDFNSIYNWGVDNLTNSISYISYKFDIMNFENNPHLYIETFRGKSPKYDSEGTKFILNQKCNRWNKIDFRFAKKVNDNWYNNINKKYLTKVGDVIVNSTGEGTIGRATYIKSVYSGWLYDSHILLLRLNTDKINPEYFTYLFNSYFGQSQIANLKSAKSTKQTELGIQNLLKISFPIPPMEVQYDLVCRFRKSNNEINKLKNKSTKLIISAQVNFEKAIFKTKEKNETIRLTS